MDEILARLPGVVYGLEGDGLFVQDDSGRRRVFSGPVEGLQTCGDGALSHGAAFVSRGQLFVTREGEEALCLTPAPREGCRWMEPRLCLAGCLAVCAQLRRGDSGNLFVFSPGADGSLRGRRLLGPMQELTFYDLVEEPPGARLYYSRLERGVARVASVDVLAGDAAEKLEFGLPRACRWLCFVRFRGRTHYAFVSGGTLFADGIPLASGEGRAELTVRGEELLLTQHQEAGEARFAFRGESWVSLGLQEAAPPPSPPAAQLRPAQGEDPYREILHNQALLLRSLQEKQELAARSAFTLEARVSAQAARIEQLHRRLEGLQAALETLERLYRP